jgi:hypothetical protein
MNPIFQRILPIIRWPLAIVGILFILQDLWSHPEMHVVFQELYMSPQEIKELNNLSQQRQLNNSPMTIKASPQEINPPIQIQQDSKKPEKEVVPDTPTQDASIIQWLIHMLILGLISIVMVPERVKEAPRIIKNLLVGFVGVILFWYEFSQLPDLFMPVILAFFIIIRVLIVGLIVGLIGMAMFPKMVKDILKRVKGVKGLFRIIRNIFVVLVGLVLLWQESSDVPSLRIPMMLAFFIIGTLMLVYTFLYFYYDHRDSVHGGYGELRDRMKVKISKINKIAKLMFCFCSVLVILSGLVVGFL